MFEEKLTLGSKNDTRNVISFGQKGLISVQFFRFLGALMKVQLIPHATFETTRSGFIQILHN